MKKKIVFLLALSVLLITAVTMNSTLAYFTSYAKAQGGYIIKLSEPKVVETFSDWTKRVTIVNDGQPVYVRVKAFAGDEYTLTYGGTGWESGDEGFMNFVADWIPDQNNPSTESTTELLIRIENIPEDLVPGDSFNVAVVYEVLPVQFDDNGNLIPPQDVDWNETNEGGPEEA